MLLLAIVAVAPLHFHFDATEFTNALYHTACLADRIACSKAVYGRFWNNKMNPTPEDGARFDGFREVFEQVEHDADVPHAPSPFLPNDFSGFASLGVRVRLMAAMLEAKSPAEFRRRVAAYIRPEQADRLAKIVEGVEQRLHPWWVSTGRPIVQPRLKNAARVMTRLGAAEMVRQVASFLDVRETAADIYMHLIPSPEYEGNSANANPSLNHFCLEVNKDYDPIGLGWVAVHEQTHSMYALSPAEKKQALMQQFVDSPDPSAEPLYMYLNEAMATAVQLLLLERNGKKDDDPYHETYIPRLAQAALPLVRDALAHKTTLFEGFAGPYIEAGRRQLGADADTVHFRFSTAVVLGDEELTQAFCEQMPLRYLAGGVEHGKLFPRVPAIHVLSYQQAAALAGEIGAMPDGATHRGFACIRRLTPERWTLFVVGRDAASIAELAKKLVERKEAAAEGVVLTLQ